jgi:hypothetical protein
MARRPTRVLWAVLLAAMLGIVALSGGAASARAAIVPLDGVKTQLTTNPATTEVLLDNAIVPLPVRPAGVESVWKGKALALRYSFPITGGRVNSNTLFGRIDHSGGILFANLSNGDTLKLTKFRIRIDQDPGLSAAVNGDPATRVRILDLDLSDAKVRMKGRRVTVKNVDATLTAEAAAALNASLGVGFFAEGIELGTAKVSARVG